MSQENVEIVLGVFDAFGRKDTAAMFAAYDPDVEWSLENYPWPETTIYKGHDGVRTFFRAWLKDFDEYETEARDPVQRADKVVVTVYDCAVGKGSGVRIERIHAQIWTLRDGRVVRVEVYDDRHRALAAVGLSEQDTQMQYTRERYGL